VRNNYGCHNATMAKKSSYYAIIIIIMNYNYVNHSCCYLNAYNNSIIYAHCTKRAVLYCPAQRCVFFIVLFSYARKLITATSIYIRSLYCWPSQPGWLSSDQLGLYYDDIIIIIIMASVAKSTCRNRNRRFRFANWVHKAASKSETGFAWNWFWFR